MDAEAMWIAGAGIGAIVALLIGLLWMWRARRDGALSDADAAPDGPPSQVKPLDAQQPAWADTTRPQANPLAHGSIKPDIALACDTVALDAGFASSDLTPDDAPTEEVFAPTQVQARVAFDQETGFDEGEALALDIDLDHLANPVGEPDAVATEVAAHTAKLAAARAARQKAQEARHADFAALHGAPKPPGMRPNAKPNAKPIPPPPAAKPPQTPSPLPAAARLGLAFSGGRTAPLRYIDSVSLMEAGGLCEAVPTEPAELEMLEKLAGDTIDLLLPAPDGPVLEVDILLEPLSPIRPSTRSAIDFAVASAAARAAEPLPSPSSSAPAAPTTPARSSAPQRDKPLVLVCDDSRMVRVKLVRLLKDDGYDVCEASDGLHAQELLRSLSPDLLITDVDMPECNGFELTRNLRATPATAALPVVMITGDDLRHRDEATRVGVSVLLGKPFGEEALLKHLRRLLRTAAPAEALD